MEPDAEAEIDEDVHDEATCLEEAAWFSERAPEPEEVEDAHGYTARHVCPDCGRAWEYYYILEGLWNPRTVDYA